MRRHLWTLTVVLPVLGAMVAPTRADWIFLPSYYTHDQATGERVNQFAQPPVAYHKYDSTYLQSGYRHNHTSIQAGGSEDQLHVVETWGLGTAIRPYGEWERPYRAGATPYGPWGNPQGPWTLPYDSWANPYGLGRMYGNPPYAQPRPYGPQAQGNGAPGASPYRAYPGYGAPYAQPQNAPPQPPTP